MHAHAISLPEVLALILVVIVGVAILLPALGTRHHHAPQMQTTIQLRGIHQGLVMYAQGNKGYFPGFAADGGDAGVDVEGRLHVMLRNNYFVGEYAINPVEQKIAWTTGRVTSGHYSFAMLQISAQGNRRAEWAETLNSDAPVLSDRNAAASGSPPTSVWSGATRANAGWSLTNRYYPNHWIGVVLWNDNRAAFEQTHVHPTTYGPGHHHSAYSGVPPAAASINASDDLFSATSDGDALMVHSGN